MDLKAANKKFKKEEVILRDKVYIEAIGGLATSGNYEDEDKLIEKAFSIAVKSVIYLKQNTDNSFLGAIFK